MPFEKVEPYQGVVYQGCLNCQPVETIAPLDMIIAVGFGSAEITKDGEPIFWEKSDDDDFHHLAEFESMAMEDPDHDWRADLQGPLRGRTYQRHDVGKWVLIDSNMGFA